MLLYLQAQKAHHRRMRLAVFRMERAYVPGSKAYTCPPRRGITIIERPLPKAGTLAQRTGLSRAAISFIEARKREPTLLTLLLIANALNCRLDTLLQKALTDVQTKD